MDQRVEVQNHINRYTDAVNRRDWDAFPSIFAADAVWEGAGRLGLKFEGLVAITKGISSLVEEMDVFIQLNTPAVISLDGDRASARTAIHELGDIIAKGIHRDIYGRYEDELVATAGSWLFRRRRFIPVWDQTTPITK